jgi:ATP-binding cassette, subfamily F, member 3
MISIENISKSFGGQTLLEDTGFRLNKGDRVGLVGRNGHGKTTLLKMIIDEESPDAGSILIPKHYRIGYVEQHIEFTQETVLKEGMMGLNENEKESHWKVEKILSGLGFSETDMKGDPYELSGGYQVRLNLVKVIAAEPDLLLLDEPTNYLDITSIRWITRLLSSWSHELLLVTHDRGFMDKVITHTVGIHRKKMRKISGNTGKYYAQIAQDEEVYEKTRQNDEKKRNEIELFINRFRAKARMGNLVQSRVKTLEKKEKKEKLEHIKNLDFSFRVKQLQGKNVMAANDLTFFYNENYPLINNLNFGINKNERICVIGKNGKGKTTLLKLLAGDLTPIDGKISYNPNIVKGVYEQTNIKSLVDSRTVAEEILYSDKDMDQQKARNIAGAMMFKGDDALKKIEVLSGGEKARVMLGKLLATPVNLLLLDEPTNHLDMDSCDALLSAIDNFDGSVIMVTHNEMFLHALAQKLIVFQDDETYLFDGTYNQFLEKGGWQDENILLKKEADSEDIKKPNTLKLNKKELRKIRSEIITNRAKSIKPIEQKIAKTENEIDMREKELIHLNDSILKASQSGCGSKIAELSQSIHKCQTIINEQFEILETLIEELETKTAIFDEQLSNCD